MSFTGEWLSTGNNTVLVGGVLQHCKEEWTKETSKYLFLTVIATYWKSLSDSCSAITFTQLQLLS